MLSTEQKNLKKRNIAKSTRDIFLNKGFSNITISEIAKVAGIGKGTIYEYFKNKEEILFELMACLQEEYDPKLKNKLESKVTTKEKFIALFAIYLSDDEIIKVQRKIYKEYLSVYIVQKSDAMIIYHKNMIEKYTKVLENIFLIAIENNEINEKIMNFIPSIFATLEGFFIVSYDKTLIYDYIENLFDIFNLSDVK